MMFKYQIYNYLISKLFFKSIKVNISATTNFGKKAAISID